MVIIDHAASHGVVQHENLKKMRTTQNKPVSRCQPSNRVSAKITIIIRSLKLKGNDFIFASRLITQDPVFKETRI